MEQSQEMKKTTQSSSSQVRINTNDIAASKYIPKITSRVEENGVLRFTIENMNVSLANALRRVILSEVPTYVFRTYPYSENKASITANTSRLHNEIIKQRLSCIPIHISDMDFPYKDYCVELDVVNDSDTIKYVTTKDFRVKNKVSGKYLIESKVHEIFPPNEFTGDYIIIGRLLPKMSEYADGERLALICDLDIWTAKENGSFNIVSTCTYCLTQDAGKVQEKWAIREQELVKEGVALASEDMADAKKDWMLLDGQRCTKEGSYDFTIETVGAFQNTEIVVKAANIMIDKCVKFISDIQSGEDRIIKSNTLLEHGYDVELKGETHTLGKVIEWFLFDQHYNEDETVSFVSFRKVHPHSVDSMIRIGFAEDIDEKVVATYFIEAAKKAIAVYTHVREMFV